VEQANELYSFTASLLAEAHAMKVYWSCENPARSHMWGTSFMQRLVTNPEARRTIFDAYQHGGTWAKRTLLLHNLPEMDSLASLCDGSHQHDPWEVKRSQGAWAFSTAQEAVYPRELCKRMAAAVRAQLVADGHLLRPFSSSAPQPMPWSIQSQASKLEAWRRRSLSLSTPLSRRWSSSNKMR